MLSPMKDMTHTISEPNRVSENYVESGLTGTLRSFGVWLALSVCLATFGIIFILTDQTTKGDSFPGNILGIVLFFMAAIFVYGAIKVGGEKLFRALRPVPMDTPQNTVKRFFLAIEDDHWEKAYGCLTDQAQSGRELPEKADPLSPGLPKELYSSLEGLYSSFETFRDYWQEVKTAYRVELKSVDKAEVKNDTAYLTIRCEIHWYVNREGKTDIAEDEIVLKKTLVKLHQAWFLTSGHLGS